MNSLKYLLFTFIVFTHAILHAQEAKLVKGAIVQSANIVFLGKSRPIQDLIKLESTTEEKLNQRKLLRKKPDNFRNRHQSKMVLPELEHQGPDRLRQGNQGSRAPIEPLVNIVGIGDSGSPLDPTGDIGKNHYVQMVNATELGVFLKDGTLVDRFATNTLWSEFGLSSAGDPIVLYDETAGRWLITEFADPSNVMIAVSESDNPLASYNAYTFTTPEFPDYPKYAVWPDAYVITTNENGPEDLHQYFLDRHAMLAGLEEVLMQRISLPGSTQSTAGFLVSTPVDWNGKAVPSNPNPIVLALNDSSWGGVAQDEVDVYRFTIDWLNASNTTVEKISIVTSPYDSYPCAAIGFGFSCIPQKGGNGLDGIPEVIMNVPHYRNFGTHESMVFSFVTDVTDGENIAGIRWVELRKTPDIDWSLYQEGTYAPDDGLHRFMSSIAMDDGGNIGMGFNISGETIYAGVRFTGRYNTDPLGEMSVPEFNVVDGLATISSFGRFGDYAQMGVDPQDGKTFWYTTEYAGESSEVTQSRIVAFQLGRDSFDLALTSIPKPTSGTALTNTESVEIMVTNAGINAMSSFEIGLIENGTELERRLISDTIQPGQSKAFIFNTTIDLSIPLALRELKAWVHSAQDLNIQNDSLSNKVTKIFHRDANLTLKENLETSFCAENLVVKTNVQNFGEDTIYTMSFIVNVNGLPHDTIEVTQTILKGKEAIVSLTITGLATGDVSLEIMLEKLNGLEDESPLQNTISATTVKDKEEAKNLLQIFTDNYPEESTWQISYMGKDEILFNGGPYTKKLTTVSETLCLNPDSCFNFKFFDSIGDGICCAEGNGKFTVKNTRLNKTLFSSNGKFDELYEKDFCIRDACTLNVTATTTTDKGSGNGSLLLVAKNGIEPYRYSIDGGMTFSDVPLFENLAHGVYEILVLSADNICFVRTTAEIMLENATTNIASSHTMLIKPNPNQGYFHLEIIAPLARENQIKFQIIDVTGKVIQERWLSKYNESYLGTISMLNAVSGTYYIRAIGKDWTTMSSFVKD